MGKPGYGVYSWRRGKQEKSRAALRPVGRPMKAWEKSRRSCQLIAVVQKKATILVGVIIFRAQ
jgi:hypothetical protein